MKGPRLPGAAARSTLNFKESPGRGLSASFVLFSAACQGQAGSLGAAGFQPPAQCPGPQVEGLCQAREELLWVLLPGSPGPRCAQEQQEQWLHPWRAFLLGIKTLGPEGEARRLGGGETGTNGSSLFCSLSVSSYH